MRTVIVFWVNLVGRIGDWAINRFDLGGEE